MYTDLVFNANLSAFGPSQGASLNFCQPLVHCKLIQNSHTKLLKCEFFLGLNPASNQENSIWLTESALLCKPKHNIWVLVQTFHYTLLSTLSIWTDSLIQGIMHDLTWVFLVGKYEQISGDWAWTTFQGILLNMITGYPILYARKIPNKLPPTGQNLWMR